MKQYQYVVFDVDGTLLDTAEGIVKAVKETMRMEKLEILQTMCSALLSVPRFKIPLKSFMVLGQRGHRRWRLCSGTSTGRMSTF